MTEGGATAPEPRTFDHSTIVSIIRSLFFCAVITVLLTLVATQKHLRTRPVSKMDYPKVQTLGVIPEEKMEPEQVVAIKDNPVQKPIGKAADEKTSAPDEQKKTTITEKSEKTSQPTEPAKTDAEIFAESLPETIPVKGPDGKPDWKNTIITGPVKGSYIVVYLSHKIVGLVVEGQYVRVYRNILTAKDISQKKSRRADSRSPVGNYYIASRVKSPNGAMLGISYPNTKDAQLAEAKGLIDVNTILAISKANKEKKMPPQDTPLGGSIFFHSDKGSKKYTDGGFALEKDEVEELWKATIKGTPVLIRK